jgi:GH25 family lysozyme M1 (1,4-beta-N-acetylmuramidase)
MGGPTFRLLTCALGALLGLGVPALGSSPARAYTTSLHALGATNTELPHGSTTQQMLASGTPSTSAAASGWTQGIDVASYQHPSGSGIDWGQVAAAGYQFVFVKATQGNYYVNPYFSGDFAGAHNAGLFRAAYHFADPSVSDGATQADYMLNTNSYVADGGTFPPALDLEDVSGQPFCYNLSPSGMVDWIAQFGNEVQRRIGRPPVIYSRASWWNQCTGSSTAFGANPLWVASFGTSNPVLPTGWNSWTFWQWTSTGIVPGITGNVDISYFAGSTSQLAAFAAHAYAQVSNANGRLANFGGHGDGSKDVVNFQQGSDAAVFVALSTGSNLAPPTRWNPWGPFCYSGATALVGDFNGDGLDDIACVQQGSDAAIFVALSTGSGFLPPTRWNPWGPFCYAGSTPIVGHFVHTRIAGSPVVDDIACVQQGSDAVVFVATSTGSSFNLPTRWNSWGSYCYAGATPVAGDFDGDGRDDLACDLQSTDGSVLIATSTGSSFNLPSRWNTWGPFCYTGSTPLAGDFNGDGRDDLACDQQSSDGAVFVTTSTGSTMKPPSRWNPGFPFCYTGMTARATKLSSAPGDGMVCFTQGAAGDVWFMSPTGSAFGNLAKWNSWGPFSASGHTPV